MRALNRLIPTEKIGISIGLGALAPLVTMSVAYVLPEEVFAFAILLTPLLCGFAGSVIYGSNSPGSLRYCMLISILSFLCDYLILLTLAFSLGGGVVPIPLASVIYLSLITFPFSFLVAFIVSITGAILGWSVAETLER